MNPRLSSVTALLGLLLLGLLSNADSALAKTVRYELTVRNQPMNLSGARTVDFALTVNGGIPAPTLEFTEGDDAEIQVTNAIASGEELSIHWHGILLPPEMDGVSYVNTPPIKPGEPFTFRFKIRQSGTYWYHSHTGLQEQKGVYGAIVIHPRERKIAYDRDVVVVLSDWSDENADQILKNLRKDGDYYLYKKDSMRSYFGAISAGSLGNYLANEWSRMGGMDLSDVGYDAFLINGKRDLQLSDAKPGERLRLRIINASASTYFYLGLGKQKMRVISADGMDVAPTETSEILIGMAETYDVLFEVPADRSVELKATAQDQTGSASGWIGLGAKETVPAKMPLDLYGSMDHTAHAHHMGGYLTVENLRAPAPTNYVLEKDKGKVHELKLVLGGDMERYVWHINGKAIHEDRNIMIDEGDVVRFTLQNETMMHHPMHLHGHFFRVLGAAGDLAPLKHTVDVPPHGSRTIEFFANEPGQWMLHCHNLYHMKTGMARVVKYASYKVPENIAKIESQDHHLHDHFYSAGSVSLASNRGEASLRFTRTWDEIDAKVEASNPSGRHFDFEDKWDAEAELFYRRWFGNYLSVMAGPTFHEDETVGRVGISYLLPLLIESRVLVGHTPDVEISLERRFQWTKTVFSEIEWTGRFGEGGAVDTEYVGSLMYGPAWAWSVGLVAWDRFVTAGAAFRF